MKIPFFHKKPLDILTTSEKEHIVQAIRQAECRTSGEIRVFIEQKCQYLDPVERASELFLQLQMQQTDNRNAVLLYVALKDQQLAIFGDEGIYKKTGNEYWEGIVQKILQHFNKENFAEGIATYIREIGEGLHRYFPYDQTTDQNELPDEIIFGENLS